MAKPDEVINLVPSQPSPISQSSITHSSPGGGSSHDTNNNGTKDTGDADQETPITANAAIAVAQDGGIALENMTKQSLIKDDQDGKDSGKAEEESEEANEIKQSQEDETRKDLSEKGVLSQQQSQNEEDQQARGYSLCLVLPYPYSGRFSFYKGQ